MFPIAVLLNLQLQARIASSQRHHKLGKQPKETLMLDAQQQAFKNPAFGGVSRAAKGVDCKSAG